MMDTVPDKLKLFNATLEEQLERSKKLQRELEKGDIEPEDALLSWAQCLDFIKFILRKNNVYISMTQGYARKKSGKQHTSAR